MKMILIGFMGSGKTTVAQQLAQILKLPIIEMDEIVLQKTNSQSMHEVFAKGGERLLREMEIAISQEYANADQVIISTGGGIVLNKITLDYLKQPSDEIFFLNTPFHVIANRITTNDRSRPLFTNITEAYSLYCFRQSLYLQYADHVIEVLQQSPQEIAQEIATRGSYGK
jgi:shikimate kinase